MQPTQGFPCTPSVLEQGFRVVFRLGRESEMGLFAGLRFENEPRRQAIGEPVSDAP